MDNYNHQVGIHAFAQSTCQIQQPCQDNQKDADICHDTMAAAV